MTNSRSRSSRSKLLGALVVACAVVGWVGVAHAERKRVVVLDFEGPKGEKFHGDLVRLLKKTHTVVPTHQWNGTAEQLDAATMLDRDVRRVARKLKVDAIVEGKIDKRRDAFLIHLKLREGKTGEVVRAGISTRADGPRIDARAQRDIKDELIGAIDEVESNGPGVDDDERGSRKRVAKAEAEPEEDDEEVDDRPVKKRGQRASKADERAKKRVARAEAEAEAEEAEEEAPPPKKAKKADERDKKVAKKAEAKAEEEDEDSLPPKKAKAERVAAKAEAKAEEEDEDSLPPKKSAKDDAGRRFSKRPDDERGSDRVAASTDVASSDDGDRVEVEAEVDPGNAGGAPARSPGQRAIELIAGASMTVRRMKFDVRDDLVQRPAEYKGGRAGGAIIDATIYPLALRSRSGILKDIGVTVMYDRMLKVSSRSQLTGMVVDTKETRLGAGLVFRHAFGSTAMAPVALASVTYSSQVFRMAADLDTPNVKYTMFEPGLGVRVPVTANLIFGLDAKFMAITNTGQIQRPDQYGTARVLGLEGALAVDYVFGRGMFARAAFRYETIGYTFKGNGLLSVNRDNMASTQDVMGARDNYIGGLASVGYLY